MTIGSNWKRERGKKDRKTEREEGRNFNGKEKQMEVQHVGSERRNQVRLLIDDAGFMLAYELLF